MVGGRARRGPVRRGERDRANGGIGGVPDDQPERVVDVVRGGHDARRGGEADPMGPGMDAGAGACGLWKRRGRVAAGGGVAAAAASMKDAPRQPVPCRNVGFISNLKRVPEDRVLLTCGRTCAVLSEL